MADNQTQNSQDPTQTNLDPSPWKGKFADIVEQHKEVAEAKAASEKMQSGELEPLADKAIVVGASGGQRSVVSSQKTDSQPIVEVKVEQQQVEGDSRFAIRDSSELKSAILEKNDQQAVIPEKSTVSENQGILNQVQDDSLKDDNLKKSESPTANRESPSVDPSKPVADSKLKVFLRKLLGIKTKDTPSAIKISLDGKKDDFDPAKLTQKEREEILVAEKEYTKGLSSVFDLIAPSSFEVAFDHLRIEGIYAQSYYVFAYPRFIEANWLNPVVNFDVTMNISQFIYPTSSEQIMKVLKKKVAQMQSTIRMNAEKGKVHDPAIETSLQDAEQLRVELQRGQERYFQFALYVTVFADDLDKLKKIEKQLQSLLGGKLVITKRADCQMEQAFNSTIPLCMDQVEIYRNMNTSPLSTTFPFSSSDLTSNDGILYGLNRHNDGLIIFDRFSLENANSVVFAKSGAGKSYAVKLEILRSLMNGSDVIVVDPENEYEALANTVGGTYLKVSLNSDRRINPFDLPRPIDVDEVKPGDLLRSVVINLSGLLKLMLGEMSPSEEGIIDKALIDVYATRGITMDTPNPGDFAPPTMDDFYNVLSSMEGATNLAQRLTKYVTGTYSGIFNKETNVDMNEGMMVFCIRDLEDNLRPIAMYIILNYIWNVVRSSLKKRILCIDEAWTMMRHRDSAEFLFGLVKRARKYYLGVTTITQDVEDFLSSEFGKPIITNSSMQLLLKQAPSALDALEKTFNLTQGERYMLLNSGVGQGLFFAGLKHVAIQIIASYTEDKIVTTNPQEILKNKGGEFS